MASKVENVFAAMPRATGALLRGPKGATLPTSARTDITELTDLVDQGFIGEDGFTQSESRDTDKKKAFGGTVVKVLQTDYSLTIQFAFMESTNAEVLKSIYGPQNVTVRPDGEIVVKKNKIQSPHWSWVIDVIDGAALNRTCIADGQITEVDDIVKVHSDTIMYTVTMECFEDANGDNLTEYFVPVGAEASFTISNGSVAPATEDSPYTVDLEVVGGDDPVTWSISAGALPAGLTINSGTGVISGTPTEAGSFNFTAKVVDSSDPVQEATRSYTLVVNPA